MSYSLEDFCKDGRALLAASDSHDSRDHMRRNLETLLSDKDFQSEHLDQSDATGLKQIYEDPDYGFCVLIYNMATARTSPPHDHGNSWAIYGQALGYTDMTVWQRLDKAGGDDHVNLEIEHSFRLDPGMAGLFDVGDIHSISYPDNAKFVRVTGTDMAKESRKVFDPNTGEVTKVEHVGTGNQ